METDGLKVLCITESTKPDIFNRLGNIKMSCSLCSGIEIKRTLCLIIQDSILAYNKILASTLYRYGLYI